MAPFSPASTRAHTDGSPEQWHRPLRPGKGAAYAKERSVWGCHRQPPGGGPPSGQAAIDVELARLMMTRRPGSMTRSGRRRVLEYGQAGRRRRCRGGARSGDPDHGATGWPPSTPGHDVGHHPAAQGGPVSREMCSISCPSTPSVCPLLLNPRASRGACPWREGDGDGHCPRPWTRHVEPPELRPPFGSGWPGRPATRPAGADEFSSPLAWGRSGWRRRPPAQDALDHEVESPQPWQLGPSWPDRLLRYQPT